MKQIIFNNKKLSKLSLGTVQFGLNYGISNTKGQPNQQKVNDIIEYVYDNGINCFDTAQAYGNSEEVLGKAIDKKDNIYLISKLKSELFINELNKNVSKSLNHLNINSLYGLLLHDSELLYSWKDEYSELVDNLIQENKIKYFGVSIYTNEDFELALNNDSIKFIQIPFNIFDQRAISQNWFKKAKKSNKLIFIRSVFLQGLFFIDIEILPCNLEKSKQYLLNFNKYCKKLNMTKSELALSFVNTIAQDSILLFGCDNLNQAKENITNYNNLKQLDESTIQDIINDFKNISEDIYNPTRW
jgi:aryl-alcohol dehydrogenase-like predicted oxidoreductase